MYQPQTETLPRVEVSNIQLQRLQAMLWHIHSSNPKYAHHLGGLGEADVRALDDLRHFPLLTKDDMREAYPFGLACKPRSEFVRMQMSSGTTGEPIICPYTANDVRQWTNVMARCLTTAGVRRSDVVQITPSFGLFNGGFGFHYGASALEAMIVPIGSGRTHLQL